MVLRWQIVENLNVLDKFVKGWSSVHMLQNIQHGEYSGGFSPFLNIHQQVYVQ